MPISGSITLRRMADTDVPFADRLRDLAGWNQSLQDWRRLLRHDPDGCYVAEWSGRPAGTATTTTYSKDLAWIGMVLVDPNLRRQGIGRALLVHCIEHLRQSGVGCIKLDATPLGKRVYGPLGFVAEWSLSRWQTAKLAACTARIDATSDLGVRPLDKGHIGCVADLDAGAFGAARDRMLAMLAAQSDTRVRRDGAGQVTGYGMLRPGQRADYLGPMVAHDESSGVALADDLLGSIQGRPLFWDIPDSNHAAVRVAQHYGMHRQRTLTRMYLGRNARPGTPSAQWAIAAPEIG